ncbi:hypothetical protein HYS99_01535 [Candidatus Giovannonibacteria bacterium]|nr:hypothetical protein [Candidatus Giovannonibacteria bacterium]
MLFAIFEIVGIAYLLWIIFVLALTSQLKEIKKTTWHYKFYHFGLFLSMERDPKPNNLCDYRAGLWIAPFNYFLYLFWVGILFGVVPVLRFVTQWTIIPFFLGRRPDYESPKKYFKDLFDPNSMYDGMGNRMNMKDFMIPPIFWVLVIAILGGVVYEIYRIATHKASATEIYISFSVFAIVILVFFLTRKITRASIKSVWTYAKEKFCRVVPVVD